MLADSGELRIADRHEHLVAYRRAAAYTIRAGGVAAPFRPYIEIDLPCRETIFS
jgi:hypothetical protein